MPQQAAPAVAASPVQAQQAAQPPLAGQLARPLFQLAAGHAGTHVMTVQLAPDSLGPVTLRAHLGADGVRIELLAATDAGRDGLRGILPELRRELAAQGVASSLDLSGSSGGGGAAGQHAFDRNGAGPPGTLAWKREAAPGPGADLGGPPSGGPGSTAPPITSLDIISLDITV